MSALITPDHVTFFDEGQFVLKVKGRFDKSCTGIFWICSDSNAFKFPRNNDELDSKYTLQFKPLYILTCPNPSPGNTA